MNSRILAIVVLAAGTLTLAACGGGSSRQTLTEEDLDRIRSDPRMERREAILERSDTLLASGHHLYSSLSSEGQTVSERMVETFSCAGAQCTGDQGTELSVQDFLLDEPIDASDEIGFTQAEIGSRGGFDTATLGARFEASESIEGTTITAAPAASIYGLWGEHGFAAITVVDGPLSGHLLEVPFSGSFGSAEAYAAGDAAGTNPTGMGSATWSGIVEAASTSDFQRHHGTATVTIADLSRPRVGVDIDIAGHDVGSPAWADIPLVDGGFASGAVDTGDYLEGHFHGSDHSETYGVFDTGDYVGGFGAKRNQ